MNEKIASVVGLWALCLPPSVPAAPRVVVSIKPLHAVVAGIMDGVGRPYLLLKGGESPHHYSLKPSQARRLRNAGLIFWIGPELETFLVKPIRVLGRNAHVVTVMRQHGLVRHPRRKDGLWNTANHDPRSVQARTQQESGSYDPHIWLDPRNGMSFARAAAGVLSRVDPLNAGRYKANLGVTLARIAAADGKARAILAPVHRQRYVVFHDAFQYFEKRYGLAGVGAITLEGRMPGARRLSQVRRRIVRHGIRCVFSEPQFDARLARTVVDGTAAKVGLVDPMGSRLRAGKGAYARLILSAARSVASCLK